MSERKYYEAYDERYKTAHEKGIRWFGDAGSPVVPERMFAVVKKVNEICTILDFPVSEEAMEISAFFCKEASASGVHNMNFNFSYNNGLARVILKETEDFVSEVMKKYYKEC